MAPASFPESSRDLGDPAELFVIFLDYYRETIAAKLAGLDDSSLRNAVLPSGWTPIELLKHVVFMERRWMVWGFLGRTVGEPWGDHDLDADRWAVHPNETLDGLVTALRAGGRLTAEVVRSHPLSAVAAVTGRFDDQPPPTLAWICFHVLQEYARHAGHLDVVRELVDGSTGE